MIETDYQNYLAATAEYIDRIEKENQDLKAQIETARRTFGTAFTKGKLSPTGSSRPNRPKLTPREVHSIRAAYIGGMKQSDLAKSYEVNPATISRLVRGVYHR